MLRRHYHAWCQVVNPRTAQCYVRSSSLPPKIWNAQVIPLYGSKLLLSKNQATGFPKWINLSSAFPAPLEDFIRVVNASCNSVPTALPSRYSGSIKSQKKYNRKETPITSRSLKEPYGNLITQGLVSILHLGNWGTDIVACLQTHDKKSQMMTLVSVAMCLILQELNSCCTRLSLLMQWWPWQGSQQGKRVKEGNFVTFVSYFLMGGEVLCFWESFPLALGPIALINGTFQDSLPDWDIISCSTH